MSDTGIGEQQRAAVMGEVRARLKRARGHVGWILDVVGDEYQVVAEKARIAHSDISEVLDLLKGGADERPVEPVTITLRLPPSVADQVEELHAAEPEFLERAVRVALTRRAINRGIRERELADKSHTTEEV